MSYRNLSCSIAFSLVVGLLLVVEPALALEEATSARLTPEKIQNRVTSVQESKEIDDATRTRAIELYQQAIANLETTRANGEAVEVYRKAAKAAPDRVVSISASTERRQGVDPVKALGIGPAVKLTKIEQDLESELGNLAALEAKLANLETSLESEAQRPALARERIAAARSLVEEAVAEKTSGPPSDQNPFLAEAVRWSRDTRIEALRSEIAMLDEELRTHGARVELLQAQRDDTALSVRHSGLRVEAMRAALNERLRDEAELDMTKARAVLDDASTQEPILHDLAKANLSLVELLQQQIEELDDLSQYEHELSSLSERLVEDLRSTRRKLQLKWSDAPLGRAIRAQRRQLPSAEYYEQKRGRLQKPITTISLRLIENEDERRDLADLDSYLVDRGVSLEPGLQSDLEALADTRSTLLERAIANDKAQQMQLYTLDDLLLELEEKTIAYDSFLTEHLLWVKSAPTVSFKAFKTLPGEVAAYLDAGVWINVGHDALRGVKEAPWILALVLFAGLLLIRGRSLHGALLSYGENVGSIQRDRMSFTIKAAALTLLLALPGTLLLAALSWALTMADAAMPFSAGLAAALMKTAILLLLVSSLLMLSLRGGLAERHYGWDQSTVAELHRGLAWFRSVGVPFQFLTVSVVALNPSVDGGTLGLLAYLALVLSLLTIIVRLLHPTRGVIRRYLDQQRHTGWWRWRYLWFAVAFGFPVSLAIAVLTGYIYTAGELGSRWTLSVWLLIGAWLGGALVHRWLLVTRRRLASNAAMMERDAARAHRAGEDAVETADQELADDNIGAPEVDLVALDADSRKLVNATLVLSVLLGLATIWGDMLPAFKVLNEVTLWSTAFRIDNVDVLVSVTLADALVALLIAIGGYILADNLPSLIDIILLKQGTVTAGSRYAITTVLKYVIVIVVTLMVLGQLGASWSQMGWAVAALGVGIGFGLQEIIANFISGLILLAERPVRVGDLITVGDASGRVMRIRIRATTIRDFEEKELLIPNKELITGRLLNWTLSDQTTRILIDVGIAYGSDVDRAIEVLFELAHEDERVLDEPEPGVVFDRFADSSLHLGFRVYVGTLEDRLPVMTDMHRKIHRRFDEEGITIALPQRDLHLDTDGPLRVSIDGAGQAGSGK